jgi:hypothetical protein
MLTLLTESQRRAIADRGDKLRESNRKTLQKQLESSRHGMQDLRKQIMESYRIDIEEADVKELLDMTSPSWSVKHFAESSYKFLRSIREANAEGGLGALLRAGAQTSVNSMYNAVPTDWEGVAQVVPSNKAIELYNPLFRAGFPSRTGEGDEPRRLRAQGQDIQIRNFKEAAIFEVTEEMIEDDLSNQVQEQPKQIGENMAIVKDAWVFNRWLGNAGTDPGGDVIPASQTGGMAGETNGWPYSNAFVKGGGKNRLTTYAAFGMGPVQLGQQLAFQMLDAKGQKLLINPDTLIAGTALADPVALFLNSEYYPVTTSMKASTSTGAGTDTGIGTQFATNIFRGRFNPVISRWLPATAYGLMQAGRGLIVQQRRPLRVIQENPTSGPAFTASVFRYKIDERWETDWIEPRFSILLNDGSVS